jgi:hypothetical protein
LLDFHIDKSVVNKVEAINDIPIDAIKCIENDFFTYKSNRKYDFVASFGFIEHFEDTRDVIKRHVDLMVMGGKLLITLPNFRGLNGLINKIFDPAHLNMHNTRCMDLNLLRKIAHELGLENIVAAYTWHCCVWISPSGSNVLVRICVRLLGNFLSLLSRVFPIGCALLSSNIILYGELRRNKQQT